MALQAREDGRGLAWCGSREQGAARRVQGEGGRFARTGTGTSAALMGQALRRPVGPCPLPPAASLAVRLFDFVSASGCPKKDLRLNRIAGKETPNMTACNCHVLDFPGPRGCLGSACPWLRWLGVVPCEGSLPSATLTTHPSPVFFPILRFCRPPHTEVPSALHQCQALVPLPPRLPRFSVFWTKIQPREGKK